MWYLYPFALLAGVCNAVQPGQNATLAKGLGRPLWAGLVTLALGATAFGAALLARGWATGAALAPDAGRLAQVPWWAWLGGVLGAGVTWAQLSASKRIGAAPFLGLVVTAGVATSIALDHFGLVGFEVHPAGLWRLAGGALMIVGVGFVARF